MIEQENLVGDLVVEATATRRHQRRWLVAKAEKSTVEVLTMSVEGEQILPVFDFKEEADLFCTLQVRDGYQARETSPGELVSILHGPCASVKTLVLDPLPKICGKEMLHLVSVSREDFVRTLLGEWKPGLISDRGLRKRQLSRNQGVASWV